MAAARTHFVYRAFDGAGRPLYVGCTGNLEKRRIDHRASSPWYRYATRFEVVGPLPKGVALSLEKREVGRLRPHFNALPEHALVVKRRAKRKLEVETAMYEAAGIDPRALLDSIEGIEVLVRISEAAERIIAPEFDERASHLGRSSAYEALVSRRAAS